MSERNKVRLLRVLDIMRKTDEKHPKNNHEICDELKANFNIDVDRKAISRDLQCLDDAGYTIVHCDNHNLGAYMIDQLFEDYELKILADAVCMAHFLTKKDTKNLLQKIEKMATHEGEKIIKETSFFDERLKTDDTHNKNKIDALIRAIRDKKKVTFFYFETGSNLKKQYKRNGHEYKISPYFLVVYKNEYFLVANSSSSNAAIHFKVEMIDKLQVLDEAARPVKEIESFYDENGKMMSSTDYLRKVLDMWSGKYEKITLECSNGLFSDVKNTFGRDIKPYNKTSNTFYVDVEAANSEGLYHWLASKGNKVKIVLPEKIKEEYRQYVKDILDLYTV